MFYDSCAIAQNILVRLLASSFSTDRVNDIIWLCTRATFAEVIEHERLKETQ